jgi:hypothetical protein
VPDEQTATAIHIDGSPYTMDDLTFREQRQMRDVIRSLAPDNDPDQASEADIVPALILVIKQRTEASFTLEHALDFKPGDLAPPPEPAAKKAAK